MPTVKKVPEDYQVILYNTLFRYLQGDLVVGLAGVYLEENPAIQHFHATGYIFKSEPLGTLVEFIKFSLYDAFTIMMQP